MALAPGVRLGAYEIVSLIGAGGMGEVYRARDSRLGRDVAIKVLPAEFSGDVERLQRFEQESRATAALNHSNILAVYDVGQYASTSSGPPMPYIVSELLEGETLRQRLAGTGLPTRKAIDYAVQIANGLAAAHEKGIAHRDLKPENLFITNDGRIKILDFGLAKLTQTDAAPLSASVLPTTPPHTLAGVVLGTAGYMSPEQVRGLGADHRSDIFALGAILYEMLSGRRAFRGETTIDALSAILKEDPPDLPTGETQISPALVRIVDRCLEKNPAARFQSTRDLAFALEGLSSHSGTAQALPSIAPRRTRREAFLWAAAAALLLTTLGLSTALYVASRPVEQFSVHALVPAPENWSLDSGAPPIRLAISPDGRNIAFVVVGSDKRRRLWVRPLDSLDAREIEGTDGAVFPFWSPDSRVLGFFAAGQLKKVQADGGPPTKICDADVPTSGAGGGATWSRDDVIVFGYGAKGLHRVPASGDAPVPVLKTANPSFDSMPSFLPDGRHFLYRTSLGFVSQTSAVMLGSLDSDERREIARGVSQAMYAQGHLLFVRNTTLMAQPFEVARLETTGDARPVVQNVLTGPGGNSAFSVSQNGVLAYMTGAANAPSRLVWVDRKGAQLGALGQDALYGTVELSNSGTLAAVIAGAGAARDVHIFDLVRQFPTRFTFETGTEFGAIWSPDDSRLVFNSQIKARTDLYIKPLGGAVGTEQILLSDDTGKYPFSWSPDGRFVMYGTSGQDQNLFYVRVEGDKTPTPFVQTSFSEYAAQFSDDGKWVAYRSNESGRPEIWIAPFPGPGKRTQVSTDGAFLGYPRWSQDGKELFFLDNDFRVMAAAIDLNGPEARVGAIVSLFESHARANAIFPYDVTSDGKRFLVNRILEDKLPATTAITIITNWMAAMAR